MANSDKTGSTVTKTLVDTVKKVLSGSKSPVIIAIDGNCGSGKTFYSSKLAELFCADVIHCDDFFLPKEMRTPERLNEIGGNVHYERLRGLLSLVRSGKLPLTYMAYNCSTEGYEEKTVNKTDVIIVEGSYALHPTLNEFYDLKILLKVNSRTQYERLLKREGSGTVNFIDKWIPLENRYFAALDTTDCIVIDTSKNETN